MLVNIYVFLTCIQLYFAVIQTELIFKRPSKPCKYGSPKNSSMRCDVNKLIKCEDRCDFTNQCNDMSDEINCGQCHFTQDMCGYKPINKGILSWIRVDGKETECSNSENESCVLSLRKDKPNKNDTNKSRARIRSPKFQSTSEFCHFTFEYKHNENDCLLSVRLVNDDLKLWSRDRLNLINQNDKNWRLQSVHIGNISTPGYQMEFLINCDEKILNRKPNKSFLQIAIKQISWTDCEKNTDQSLHSNGFDCDFQSNLCKKWSDFELTEDKFLHWKRSNNHLIFGNNFESNQYFAFTEKTDKRNTSQIARLSSIEQKSIDTIISISFEYLITNSNDSSLYLLIKNLNLSGITEKEEIWRSKPSEATEWRNASIEIPNNFSKYQLIFEAHFETSANGIVAIKNITQSQNQNQTKPTNHTVMSELHIEETSLTTTTIQPSIQTQVSEHISITTLESENTDIITGYTNITDLSLETTDEAQHLYDDYMKMETYAWILKGTAILIVVIVFLTIKFWRTRRRGEELLPLTDSYDYYNQSINSGSDQEL